MKYSHVSYDWKQGGSEEEWEEALKKFDLVLTDDPINQGSDQYGFFITKKRLTKIELIELTQEEYGTALFETDEEWADFWDGIDWRAIDVDE